MTSPGARASRPLVSKWRPTRGLTLMELLFTVFLMTALMLLCLGAIGGVCRSSARAGRSAVDLMLSARLAEQFRDDVRSARAARVAPGGERVDLDLAAGTVTYRRAASGNLERLSADGNIAVGPNLHAVSFALQTPPAGGLRLLRCVWTFPAQTGALSRALDGRAGSALVLETALRAQTEEARP